MLAGNRNHRDSSSLFSNSMKTKEALILMGSKFLDTDDLTKYLAPAQRTEYLATFSDGKLLNHNRVPLLPSRYLYVLDQNYQLYVIPESYGWHHSYLVAGEPVLAAGLLTIDNYGNITSISNESGHYSPTLLMMLPALHFFYRMINPNIEEGELIGYESHDEARQGVIKTYHLHEIIQYIRTFQDLPILQSLIKSQRMGDSVILHNISLDSSRQNEVVIAGNARIQPPVSSYSNFSHRSSGCGQKESNRFFSRFGQGAHKRKIDQANHTHRTERRQKRDQSDIELLQDGLRK